MGKSQERTEKEEKSGSSPRVLVGRHGNMRGYRIWTFIVLCVMIAAPGLMVYHQVPAPVPRAGVSLTTGLGQIRAAYPHAQVLTVVPDVYHHAVAYRYRLRMPNGRLWHVYLDARTDRILATQPLPGIAPRPSPTSRPTQQSVRQKALAIAYQAVGGGQIVTVKTNTEDHGRIYIIELMLTNGQYAKVRVNPNTAQVLSIQVEKVDH